MERLVRLAVSLLVGGCLMETPDWSDVPAAGTEGGSTTGASTQATATTSPTTTENPPTETSTTSTATTETSTTTGTSTTTSVDPTTGEGSTGGFPPGRIEDGLTLLLDFVAGSGTTISDQSGIDPPVEFAVTGDTAWTANGLLVQGSSLLTTDLVAPERLATTELTVELWLDSQSPTTNLSDGPRVFAFEEHAMGLTNVYVTAGDGVIRFDLLSSDTGQTQFELLSIEPGMRHVVFTVSSIGEVRGYENGQLEALSLGPSLAPMLWMDNRPLCIANASDSGHPWMGELALIAMYDRALSDAEIQHNFAEGY